MNDRQILPGTREIDFGELPTTLGASPFPGVATVPQGPRNDLASIRMQFPFVPIMPYPAPAAGVILAAGAAQDIVFPQGTCVFILSGNGDYYASVQGAAELPTAANVGQNKSVFRPEFAWFYTQAKSISVIAPNANTYVQALCYIPTQLPSY